MRYNLVQYYPCYPDDHVDEDWIVREAKERMVRDLVDKLPIKISNGGFVGSDIKKIEFDLWIEEFEEYCEFLKKIHDDE